MRYLHDVFVITLIGCGATLCMDLWLVLLKRIGVPVQGFALIGRWVGHMAHGRFAHEAIGKAPPVRGEVWMGWITHYIVGIAFAFLLVGVMGTPWLRQPTLLPALAFGLATVVAPLCLMQPAMGAGLFARRTPAPMQNVLRSLANHLVFGVGLYAAALAMVWISSGGRP